MLTRNSRAWRRGIEVGAALALVTTCVSKRVDADTPRDDAEEVVDPEEVVDEEGEPLVSAPPTSLCIIHEAPERATFLFIPYAEHDIWRPCHGKNRSPMSYAEFYSAAGRPDLTDEHDSIAALDTGLFWGEFALTLGAFGFAVVALFGENPNYWWAAGGSFAGAITLSFVRGASSPLPIDSREAERLAAGYAGERASRHGTRGKTARLEWGLFIPVVDGRF